MGSAEILKRQTDNWLRVSGVCMLAAAAAAAERRHTRMTNTSPRPKLDFDCVVYISTESQMLEGEKKKRPKLLRNTSCGACGIVCAGVTPLLTPSHPHAHRSHPHGSSWRAPGAGGLHRESVHRGLMKETPQCGSTQMLPW